MKSEYFKSRNDVRLGHNLNILAKREISTLCDLINIDDRKFIKSVGSAVMKLQFDSEKMPNKDRDSFIIKELSNMEKNGAF